MENLYGAPREMLTIPPPPWPLETVWGVRDDATNTVAIHSGDRPWFTVDIDAGKVSFPEPAVQMTEAEIVASFHAEADFQVGESICYFMGGDDGAIKIGHSANVLKRMREFQPGCPVRLRVLATAPGGRTRETAYHWQFRDHRLHGEWFTRAPEILAEIERIGPVSPQWLSGFGKTRGDK